MQFTDKTAFSPIYNQIRISFRWERQKKRSLIKYIKNEFTSLFDP